MNEKRFSIFNIFLFCVVFGLFFFIKIDSYAQEPLYVETYGNGQTGLYYYKNDFTMGNPEYRYALLLFDYNSGQYHYAARFYSNSSELLPYTWYQYGYNWTTGEREDWRDWTQNGNFFFSPYQVADGIWSNIRYSNDSYTFFSRSPIRTNIPCFTDYNSMIAYLSNGEVAFDNSLTLDEFYVWDYGITDTVVDQTLHVYNSVFKVSWSNPNISSVKVRIDGTDLTQDYVSQSSPYIDYFNGGNFAHLNGETVNLTATPYGADGSFGVSLYCTLKYDGNGLLTNLYRKFTNTPHQNNTLDIPYNDVEKTYEVDGVVTNNTYKVYYNPTTNEYGDLNLYEVYYSPVIIYEQDTPTEEIQDTQNVVNNSYVTNNYYNTTQTIKYNFDFDINDISAGDIKQSYDDVGGFLKGLGSFIGKLSSIFGALFPFISGAVSAAIVIGFGILVLLAIIALFIKIIK